jgi:hypothetical protein
MKVLLEKRSGETNSKDFKVTVTDNNCWVSVSHKAKDGSGYTKIRRQKKNVKAHRYFYEKFIETIPEGLHVLHKCDNPNCCNPNHMFLGTNTDNVADKISKGRQPSHVGISNPKCKISEDDVIKIFYDQRKQEEISRQYNISTSTIRDIKKFRTWTHLTNKLMEVR